MDEFVAAGLFDPQRDVGSGRDELLRWLTAQGFSVDELVDAERRLALGAVAGDRRMVPGERVGRATAIERSGLDPAAFDAFAMALGFTSLHSAPTTEARFVDAEIEAVATLGALAEGFSEAEAMAFFRVIGASLGRLAEAAVSMFLLDIEQPHLTAGESEFDLARKVYDNVGLVDELIPRLDPLLRRHLLQAIERTREAMIGETDRTQFRFAVGFVDLVGFTAMSSTMDPVALATFLRDFEARAYDLASSHRARVVKLIGDEVMFVATDPTNACAAGRALIEGFTLDGVVPRGGLAFGDVLLRAGDYLGTVVNLASRLVDEAVPGELLVTEALAEASQACEFEPAGRRQVKGFAAPVSVRSLLAVG